jgi:competence protein ComEA
MFKDRLRSQFVFNQEERIGILSLIAIIIIGLSIYKYTDERQENPLDLSSEEILRFTKEMDSLRAMALEARQPKRYPFNPNFITDFKAYTLGMTSEEFDRLKAFRGSMDQQ